MNTEQFSCPCGPRLLRPFIHRRTCAASPLLTNAIGPLGPRQPERRFLVTSLMPQPPDLETPGAARAAAAVRVRPALSGPRMPLSQPPRRVTEAARSHGRRETPRGGRDSARLRPTPDTEFSKKDLFQNLKRRDDTCLTPAGTHHPSTCPVATTAFQKGPAQPALGSAAQALRAECRRLYHRATDGGRSLPPAVGARGSLLVVPGLAGERLGQLFCRLAPAPSLIFPRFPPFRCVLVGTQRASVLCGFRPLADHRARSLHSLCCEAGDFPLCSQEASALAGLAESRPCGPTRVPRSSVGRTESHGHGVVSGRGQAGRAGAAPHVPVN